SLTELLGPPSRTSELANTIDTWDDLGIYSYRKPGESLVTSINVAVSWGANDFSPHSRFAGSVHLPGGTIDLASTRDELRAIGRGGGGSEDRFGQQGLGRYGLGATWRDAVLDVFLEWRGPDPQHVTGPPLGEDELFAADSRAYGFPMDMTLREVSHRGNVS